MKYRFLFFLLASLFLIACSNEVVKKENRYYVSPPNTPWILSFPAGDLKLERVNHKSDWERYYIFSDENGYIFSFFVEPSYRYSNPKLYSDERFEATKKVFSNIKNIVKTNYPDYSIKEYLIPYFNSKTVNQYFVSSCYIKENWWIDATLSKMQVKETEKAALSNFYNEFTFQSKEPGTLKYKIEDSLRFAAEYYLLNGTLQFMDGDLECIDYLEKAYENEKYIRKRLIWFMLCDQLFRAYSLKGELNKAKKVAEQSIEVESDYPMFYYNLATYYAKKEDLENALKYLRLAHYYRRNMFEYKIPNPATDDSFTKMMYYPKFQQFIVEELNYPLE